MSFNFLFFLINYKFLFFFQQNQLRQWSLFFFHYHLFYVFLYYAVTHLSHNIILELENIYLLSIFDLILFWQIIDTYILFLDHLKNEVSLLLYTIPIFYVLFLKYFLINNNLLIYFSFNKLYLINIYLL